MTETFTKNVLGTPIGICSSHPKTGFYRDGCCRTGKDDLGRHVICAVMTKEFLAFSKARGNDLSTPVPGNGFPGLRPGDRWCLCADRWKEALEQDMAPPVRLDATHESALEVVTLEQLLMYAVPEGQVS